MPSSCAANNCVVRYKKGLDVKFHRFPKNEILRNEWVIAIGRKDYKPSATAVICSNHFKAEDYSDNPSGTIALKKEAIPSVFDFLKIKKNKNSRNATDDIPPTSPVPNSSESLTSAEHSGILYVVEEDTVPCISQATQTSLGEEELIPSNSKASQTQFGEEELILSNCQASQTPLRIFHDSDPDVISHELTPLNSGTNIRKRKRSVAVYVGDYEESDLESPRKRHEYWNISQLVIQQYRRTNKYLNCKLRRSNKKIAELSGLLDDLRKRHQISSKRR